MKKLLVFGAFAVIALTVVSCKKDWACECNGIGATFTYDTLLLDMKKKEAEDACNDMDVNFFGYGQECELK